ncbi:choline transporter-like protein [Kockovaella imperatae]|uniref:Protein PNS1 n=1 Tax=Kockovaella imperatae TaxID=4999 RepID=A0A1Y1UB26_9TREE|nr:choline transporter-like protein [Kockovaella imperatae]ORX35240.1 choline transporter-like protein [Kockovaella imperatae]
MMRPTIAGMFVYLGPALLVVGMLAEAALFFSQTIYLGGCVNLGSAAVLVLVVYLLRHRFELAKMCLMTAAEIIKHNFSIIMVTFTVLIIQLALVILNIFATLGVFLRFQPAHQECGEGVYCSAAVTVAGCVFTIFAQIWLSSVISNLMIVALAGGPFSSDYFHPRSQETGTGLRLGSWDAFSQAVKHSTGAAAFGAFLVGFIHFVHSVVNGLCHMHGNIGAECLACCCRIILGWLLAILDWLVSMFNKYVYNR